MSIIVYTKQNCGSCIKAKALLSQKEIEYTEVSIDDDVTRGIFVEQFPDVRTVPFIIIDDVKVGNYEQLVEYLK
jgi:glutaredoxin 3